MRTTTLLTSLLVAGSLVLTGCGSEAESASAAGDDAGESSAPAASADGVTVEATEFAFDPGDFALPADTDVELTLDNKGVVEHDIVVEELDDTELVYADGGTSTTETVNVAAGTYTFYCSIPGHRQSGMEGTLTVE